MRFLQLFFLTCALVAAGHARPFMVVAYNVENLFDLDGVASYEDYQPSKYTRAHALTKLQNIARVVARFEGGRGPDVLILNELEVDSTPGKNPPDYDAILARYAGMKLEEMLGAKFSAEIGDLPAEALLAKALADAGITGYRIVVGDSTPAPGERKQEIKNAVFTRFPVKHTRSHATPGARAILEVAVEIDGAPLFVFANHWKSGASDPATEPTRAGNARTLRTRLDEILRNDPNADIVIGGDLNSQYNQKQRYTKMKTTGINDVLGSQGNELAVRTQRDLYNLWFELPPADRGSDTYRGEWGTLMHLIIARGLYDFRGVQYVDNSFAVGKFTGLNADDKGEPVRWAFDGAGGRGFSDHFPVSAKFVTVTDNRTDRYLPLRNASAERAADAAAPVKIDYTKIDLEKVAVVPANLPAGANLRADLYKGKIVRVEGKVAKGTRLAVEFAGETYDIHSFDEDLRKKLRADFSAGDPIKFYGEIGQYRERWQFIIRDPELGEVTHSRPMLKLYTYANCDTCRRAVKWLRAEGLAFDERPIRETPPSLAELRTMLAAQAGELRKLFNTSGRDYREQKLGEKLPALSEAAALALLAGNGNLVKRPFLLGPGVGLTGFDEAAWSAALSRK